MSTHSGPKVRFVRGRAHVVIVVTRNQAADAVIKKALTFTTKEFLKGRELRLAKQQNRPPVKFASEVGYAVTRDNTIIFAYGLLEEAMQALRDHGFNPEFIDKGKTKREEEIFTPNFENVFSRMTLRYRQDEFLAFAVACDTMLVSCPPGYGKSFMIAALCLMFPKARILVTTDRVPVLRDRILPELRTFVPSVGMIGGGSRDPLKRVMCVTFDSLTHVLETDFDLIIIDEVHEAAAASAFDRLSRIIAMRRVKMIGLSASIDMRSDGRDFRCRQLCGPIRMEVTYQEAVEHGIVVPIKVLWRDIDMDYDPTEYAKDHEKERYAIWANKVRNAAIVADARQYPDDMQVMISVKTVEHALRLKALLPEFTLVYAEDGASRENYQGIPLEERLKREGLVFEEETKMTLERRIMLAKDAAAGKLKKFIATGVFNVGVDLKYLSVLIRADGSGSAIMDTQIPGRVSRVNVDGKQLGIVHDYRDRFSPGYLRKSKSREATYDLHQWTQVAAGSRKHVRT